MSWTLKEVDLPSKIILAMGALLCLLFTFRIAVPTSIWFEVGELEIHSAARWQDVTVSYNRVINREFAGSWRVEIDRRVDGGWEEVCATRDNPNVYRPDSILPSEGTDKPDTVSLEWFTGSQVECYQLPPAEYRGCAYWTVNTNSWLGILTRFPQRCGLFEVVGE